MIWVFLASDFPQALLVQHRAFQGNWGGVIGETPRDGALSYVPAG